MGEEIAFENGRIPTFNGSRPWPWIGSYCVPSCITHQPLPTHQVLLNSKKLFVDRRTFETHFIRSTQRSRPNNNRTSFTVSIHAFCVTKTTSRRWIKFRQQRQTFRTNKTPGDIDTRVISTSCFQVWSKVSTADNVQATKMYTAGCNAEVICMVRRGTTYTLVHSTCTNQQCVYYH